MDRPEQPSVRDGINAHPEFSVNCREELDGHVACVKLFLEQHVVHGEPYVPGSEDDRDRCRSTRSLYMRCMQNKKNFPTDSERVAHLLSQPMGGPKACEMELTMHGNCVAIQLERAQKLGEKYWTQGGEDRCMVTRANYERCMYGTKLGLTDRWGGDRLSQQLEKNIAHLQVRLDHK
ncbi:jmjC domain-containing protein, putative [Eimeria brunetti]|uniref:JmjC domain-containing protein, putative n=1 Tax=Eimeria brunetti TaxID=51314 RepID=U6LJF9_9EIME|nr:jmjC domain-containing protein, putative [Eimeria brunetti]